MPPLSHRRALLKLQELRRVRRVRVVCRIGPHTCLACLQADGRVYELDEALHDIPLPCPGCTCAVREVWNRRRGGRAAVGGCRCRYQAMWESYVTPLAPSASREATRARLKAEYITARMREG